MTALTMFFTLVIPIWLRNVKDFNFVVLPLKYYFYLLVLVLAYALIEQYVKRKYIKKNKKWL